MPDAMIHSVGLRRRRSASRTGGLRVKIRTDARTVLTLRMAPLCLLPPPLYCGAVWIVWYMAPVTSENKREMGGRKEIIALDPAEDGACADPVYRSRTVEIAAHCEWRSEKGDTVRTSREFTSVTNPSIRFSRSKSSVSSSRLLSADRRTASHNLLLVRPCWMILGGSLREEDGSII